MLALDHIVFSGINLQFVTKEYENIALKSVKGGEHANWGTYNYLAYFSNNCYIEWLGIGNGDIAKQSDNPLIQHLIHTLATKYHGPFQFALRTTKLDEYMTHFEKNNIPYIGPVEGQRTKPDGSVLHWRMLFPSYDFTKETLPFLIEWGQSEADRFDVSIINSQAITSVKFGGVNEERFQQIYQLRPRPRRKFRLSNAKMIFTNDGKLDIDII